MRRKKIGGMDDYDFYLWGARALLTIQNPECHNGKKLLLFRDSFGSSIAPLLAEYYEEVTLVDLRYVSASHALELLGDTEYQDVLFFVQCTDFEPWRQLEIWLVYRKAEIRKSAALKIRCGFFDMCKICVTNPIHLRLSK